VPLRRKARPPPPDSAFTYGNSSLNPSLRASSSSSHPPSARANSVRHRNRPQAARRAPWQDAGSDEGASSEAAATEDEDDLPLGTLAARQQLVCLGGEAGAVEEDEENDRLLPAATISETSSLHTRARARARARAEAQQEEDDVDPDRSVRIRRGSEGYEIRPRAPSPPREGRSGNRVGGEYPSDDSSWELAGGEAEADGAFDSQEDEEEPESEYEVDEEGDRRRVGARYKYYVREEDSESDLESLRSVSEEGDE
jgi:hypothetical protein